MSQPACPAPKQGQAEGRPSVADIFRCHGPDYLRDHILPPAQGKALRAIIDCRTAALGGHLQTCLDCGKTWPTYNSCFNRHCPTCQGAAAARWLESRLDRILPTHYFHVVFTLPEPLRCVALANPKRVYDLLFAAATDTLQTLAASKLEAQLGITAVLHTWTREMLLHPHLHCVVTGGGLSLDQQRWVACREKFLFSVHVMGDLFRGKFMAALLKEHAREPLHFVGTSAHLADPHAFASWKDRLYKTHWVVFAKRPFGGPTQVITYLARYTHRVAISNSRVLAANEHRVVLKTRGERTVTLRPDEFIRRFLLHVLPPDFRKIRHYGLLAPANVRSRFLIAHRLLDEAGHPHDTRRVEAGELLGMPRDPVIRCPACGSTNVYCELLGADARAPPVAA